MTAPLGDPYAILGVATQASDDDLDRAFRRLVRQHHPDTRTSATSESAAADQRLQEILNAYATLRDPIRRATLDRIRVRRTTAPAPRPAAPDAGRVTRAGPAIRVGPVRWEPPRATRGYREQCSGSDQ